MSTTHSTNNYKEFFAIYNDLKAVGYTLTYQQLIWSTSLGKHESVKTMSAEEYKYLCSKARQTLVEYNSKKSAKDTAMKRKVIALLCQMGYTDGGKSDMIRINAWCRSHGHLKLDLNGYSGEDLILLVSQAEMMYKKFIEAL